MAEALVLRNEGTQSPTTQTKPSPPPTTARDKMSLVAETTERQRRGRSAATPNCSAVTDPCSIARVIYRVIRSCGRSEPRIGRKTRIAALVSDPIRALLEIRGSAEFIHGAPRHSSRNATTPVVASNSPRLSLRGGRRPTKQSPITQTKPIPPPTTARDKMSLVA